MSDPTYVISTTAISGELRGVFWAPYRTVVYRAWVQQSILWGGNWMALHCITLFLLSFSDLTYPFGQLRSYFNVSFSIPTFH